MHVLSRRHATSAALGWRALVCSVGRPVMSWATFIPLQCNSTAFGSPPAASSLVFPPPQRPGAAVGSMGKAKKTRKFAEVKRMMNPKDVKP